MASAVGKIGFKLIGLAFAVPSGIAVKKALNASWRRSRGHEPPKDHTAPETDWLEAITWAAVSAAVITAGQIAATRGAEAAYRALTGRPAPRKEPEPDPT